MSDVEMIHALAIALSPVAGSCRLRRRSACLVTALIATGQPILNAGSVQAPQADTRPQSAERENASTPQVPYTLFELPNGLRVILHEDHSVPIVAVNVWYHVGSGREKPGRTGFAHLFEHLMFEGSKNVAEGQFDRLLESVGGANNGSTTGDRTNYFITAPSNALELALFLESDRMGYFLDVMSPDLVNGQRDVVKNERRESFENQPYGMASLVLGEMLYPSDHPYHWPTIGYMDDLTAASYEDVVEFHRRFYSPNNASLVVAGDIDAVGARALVEKWFGEIPRGPSVEPLAPAPPVFTEVKTRTIEDNVQLPRLYLAWVTPPLYAPGEAALDVAASILAEGKNSRLYRRLVYELQIAQDVAALQDSSQLQSLFVMAVTARPGHTTEEIKPLVDEELERFRQAPPAQRELDRVLNQVEAGFYEEMESLEDKAEALNSYLVQARNPDFFAEDLARYRALAPTDIQAAVRAFLPATRRVELTVVPLGSTK